MIKAIPNNLKQVIASNDGMQRYLDSLAQGRSFTPRSWLYEDKSPKEVLDDWLNVLETLLSGNSFEKEVYHFDTSQLAKWGPQGGIAPVSALLEEYVLPSFGQHSPAVGFNSLEWDRACGKVQRLLKKAGVRAVSRRPYSRVVDDMRARDTLESNSGWPDFTRRNKPEVVAAAIEAAENGDWSGYPAIALFRNYNLKTRLVWMFPMAANIFEGSSCQPLQSAIVNSGYSFVAPWRSFDEVRNYITQAYDLKAFLYATDFSKTDEHFTWSATEQVDGVLGPLMKTTRDAQSLHRSLRNMHTVPLIISDSEMVVGEHGVSSGSNWTNFIETIFDDIFGYFCSYSLANIGVSDVSGLYGIGDDMCWISDTWHDDMPKHFSQLGKLVGQDVNPEKVTAEPDKVKTLQRLFQRNYRRPDGKLRGVYSTIRALKSSVYPERFHKPSLWSSDMFCARQYMILENCVDHPLFEEFVKFVVRGQKDLIPFAQNSKKSLDKILRETKLLPGFNPTYNQEKRDTSLASFQSIRIARTLA